MAQAYAIKTGKMKPEDLDPKYKTQIMDLANSMKEEDLKDYAETPHTGLPDVVKEDEIPMFESFLESQTLNEGVIKRKVISIIEYTGEMWKERAKEGGSSEKNYAEEVANDLGLVKGSMKWTGDLFLINGYTEKGTTVYVKQQGEFNKYGGPYEPKMYKWVVELNHKWMEDEVNQAYNSYGWDFTSGNKLDISRTDIWGYIVKEFDK